MPTLSYSFEAVNSVHYPEVRKRTRKIDGGGKRKHAADKMQRTMIVHRRLFLTGSVASAMFPRHVKIVRIVRHSYDASGDIIATNVSYSVQARAEKRTFRPGSTVPDVSIADDYSSPRKDAWASLAPTYDKDGIVKLLGWLLGKDVASKAFREMETGEPMSPADAKPRLDFYLGERPEPGVAALAA